MIHNDITAHFFPTLILAKHVNRKNISKCKLKQRNKLDGSSHTRSNDLWPYIREND
jgi:hypothetical protein